MFELNPVLGRDSILVGHFSLCQLRIINDAQFPWFILVPQRNDISEIYQLVEEDRQQLLLESCVLAEVLHDAFSATKLNVAALGNQVPQLHVHHIVRYKTDPCWPDPIWGKNKAVPYAQAELAEILQKVQSLLSDELTLPSDGAELYY
ncbi:HIT domain-containing protein [Marinomonas foliarum]|jgi:diadenosine tetraphosphate (Ap4A) HIT family hydrolase|uniref:Diadenosine tetraphosphate (Ap4A) HIT family hydrolase n=1 Tax=Marinomonas foliarum TaxID=491950 RepID=A0A368ZPM2_9GAMM|nr:HIT domain-containing protein [Marinomonas foliarum]QRV24173.1 HIT domain-containing protein [Marinomonas foliarum]RCW97011.1 diadenosine tetraphosphate (Ap4A) HIT family hydrolase [Marinomonas foliarum]